MDSLNEFLNERAEALLSMDKQKIIAYYKKWNGTEIPTSMNSDELFWIAIHKAITGAKDLPLEARKKSKAWLAERDFKSLDDGDL